MYYKCDFYRCVEIFKTEYKVMWTRVNFNFVPNLICCIWDLLFLKIIKLLIEQYYKDQLRVSVVPLIENNEPVILPANGFVQKAAKTAIWDTQLWWTSYKTLKKREKCFNVGKGEIGRGCYNQDVHRWKLGVWSMVTVHWLSWQLLIGWVVVGQGDLSFPACGSKVVSLPATDAECMSLSVGVYINLGWYMMRDSLSGLLTTSPS